MCAYERKICEDKFGGCKNLFLWLGQKVNKKIAAMVMTPAQTCPSDDATSRQDISTPFSILIEFEPTEDSYSKFREYSI